MRLMWTTQILLAAVGLSAGAAVAGGLFAFIVELGVVADFADRTHTADKILFYESCAAAGGIVGKELFELVRAAGGISVSIAQQVMMIALTLGVLVYTLNRPRIVTRDVKNPAACVVIGLVLGNGAHLLGQTLLGIYTGEPEVIAYGMMRLGVVSVTYCLCGMMDVVAGSVRGLGYSILPMLVSLVGACVFRIIWIFTVFQWQHTLFSLYISYPISWALTICAHLVCYFAVRRRVFPRTAEK